ncbi:hypothetical protein [Streptomyces sp. NRRL F-5126]|uniref:hypothetical protein n=1 Tax=Streptomyces sp. NRRL F-5126 TaxID=1463857 RepID=UPI0004C9188F|nr:hypothetical protein [Streptomyces sp. NRRL F-5126]
MTATPASATTGPGDGLVRAGGVLFIVGAVATLVTVAPLFLGTKPFPTAAYLVCMLMAVGFVVAAAGVMRSIGAQRRQAKSFVPSASAARVDAASPAASGEGAGDGTAASA